MRRLFSYINSHIYDIHAMAAAVIAIGIMYLMKKPMKAYLERCVDRMLLRYPEKKEKRELYRKRYNMVLILLTMVVSALVFAAVSVVSPMIRFSLKTAIMSGVFALCGYAFIDQITFDIRE